VVDVSDPAAPVEVGAYDPPGVVVSVHVAGDYAYVGDEDGLRVVDVSDPTTLAEVGAYDLPWWADDVYVASGYAYVADGIDGLFVLRFPASASVSIPPAGGSLTSPFDQTTYIFAAGTFTDAVSITHIPHLSGNAPSTGKLIGIGHIFEVTAVYSSTGQPAQPIQPYTVTVQYTDAEKGPTIENTLALFWWDGAQWVRAEPTSQVNTVNNTVTATPDHFSLWAVLGETRRVFLPVVLRNY
jgi:hypothetical protein